MKQYKSLAAHNAACNNIYYKYQDCEEEHKFGRYLGYCYDIQKQVAQCIKEQRKIQQEASFQASRRTAAKMREARQEQTEPVIKFMLNKDYKQ